MRFVSTVLSISLLLVCSLGLASADDAKQEISLPEALTAFLGADSSELRMLHGMNVAMNWRDAAEVAAALPAARTWAKDAPKDDVVIWKRKTNDDVEHAIFANIPAAYDPAKAWPVLIWLHGGVARDEDGGGASGIRGFKEVSDEEGFLLLSPSAQKGSEWWTPNGVALVRGALADLAQRYHVDGNRVAVSGFSDGASGCFHLLAHDPEPYACFMPLMAHPGLTRLMGGPCFAANIRARPVLAYNGGQDALYPSARIKPLIEELKTAGCDIDWTDLPEAGHRMSHVLPDQWERLRTFWQEHPRDALPKQIAWESAVPALDGRFGWVEVVKVDPQAPSDPELKASSFKDPVGRPVLGIQLDQAHRGPGIKIGSVSENSAAKEAGFLPGDLIVSVDGESLETEQAFVILRRALGKLTDREGVFGVKRNGTDIEIRCQPRVLKSSELKRPEGLGYGQPSGRILAQVEKGNVIRVRTRHVGEFTLHLAPGLVDLGKPVTIILNGKAQYRARAKGSVRYVLEEALRAGPGAPVWQATITLKP